MNKNKKNLYILGHPVSHSKSPVMYNAVYPRLGLDWEYGFMDIGNESNARKFMEGKDFLSINITTPYKPLAFEAADLKAASATLAQGVNLLINKESNLLGFNVDGEGCISYLEHAAVNFSDAKVAICGTGPTSLAILHSAASAGAASVLLLSRNKDKARAAINRYLDDYHHLLSTAIQLPSVTPGHLGFKEAYEHAEFKYGSYDTSKGAIEEADIIIDATPLGMNAGDSAPFDTSLLSNHQIVMDVVYGHGETQLVHDALNSGARVFDGAGMLVSQAVITATMVCEVNNVDIDMGYDELFNIMAEAAGFDLSVLTK